MTIPHQRSIVDGSASTGRSLRVTVPSTLVRYDVSLAVLEVVKIVRGEPAAIGAYRRRIHWIRAS